MLVRVDFWFGLHATVAWHQSRGDSSRSVQRRLENRSRETRKVCWSRTCADRHTWCVDRHNMWRWFCPSEDLCRSTQWMCRSTQVIVTIDTFWRRGVPIDTRVSIDTSKSLRCVDRHKSMCQSTHLDAEVWWSTQVCRSTQPRVLMVSIDTYFQGGCSGRIGFSTFGDSGFQIWLFYRFPPMCILDPLMV